MATTIISSTADIRAYLDNANPDGIQEALSSGQYGLALDAATEALRAQDHPRWGTDWSDWLAADTVRAVVTAAIAEATEPQVEIEVELVSAVGPRVLVAGDVDTAQVEGALPEGWTVGDNWSNGVRLTDGRMSYPLVHEVRCGCGEWTGVRCDWSGSENETVLIEFMPVHLRASHSAAGNRGVYPVNGALRVRAERSCAEAEVTAEPDWATIVDEPS